MKVTKDQTKHIGRLLKRADFLRVQGAGRKWVTPTCVVQMAAMPTPRPDDITCRYGITITKKIFKNAVDRNRVRRRIRPLVLALLSANGAAGQDLVILPRESSLKSPPETLEKDLKWALKRLNDPDSAKKAQKNPKNDI